ncbi:uncharacterized protein LOC103991098 [Musa acuminata AAA Group]|uniref:uncharacterized protein LOC103991098 n=1 Tax=Musa acuminata AAA Group TaxID=214697 RepID=UPI0031E2B5C7
MSKKPLITTLVDLLDALDDVSFTSMKDMLKLLFSLVLYSLNNTALIELGIMPPHFAPMVKDGRRGLVGDTMAMITRVAGCDESMKAFRRVNGVNVLEDLAVGRSGRARQNATTMPSNIVKSDKAMGDRGEGSREGSGQR